MNRQQDAAISAYISNAINARSWSQREAARKFGLHRSTLRRRYDQGGWTIGELRQVAEALGQEPHVLIARAEHTAYEARHTA